MTRTSRIAHAIQKGGAGKTETTQNTADALAVQGHSVLVVDFDPQGSLTKALALPAPQLPLTEALFRRGEFDTAELMVVSEHNAHLPGSVVYLPRTLHALDLEHELMKSTAREQRLSRLLDKVERQHEFDFVLIDTPPALGTILNAALYSVRRQKDRRNGVAVPVLAEKFCVDGLPELFQQISALEDVMEIDIDLLGFVINRYNSTKGNAVRKLHGLIAGFGLAVLVTLPERTALMQKAEARNSTAVVHDPNADITALYGGLAKRYAGDDTETISTDEQAATA